MLCGYPPFFSDSKNVTAKKIVCFKEYLGFPQEPDALSSEAVDLISHLIADPEERYGFEEILRHPFFNGVTVTDSIRHETAPFYVELSHAKDRQYLNQHLIMLLSNNNLLLLFLERIKLYLWVLHLS
ncbi:putative serine/threonine protein kinase [Trypanosoma cruzi]|nr:putative serine/threonine protein kinase [Trypanosoma cruzi]